MRNALRTGVIAATAVAAVALSISPAMADVNYGDRGVPVWCAQHVVHTYFGIGIGGSEDSIFGNGTRNGVKNYQARKGNLSVDGMVGPNTGHAMRLDVNAIHRDAIQDHNTSLINDTQHWLNTCPSASSVYN
jgi:peptidoglycan hydrolase-like protein with peptidoglycan-binding domain